MAAITVNADRVAPVFARDAEIYAIIAGATLVPGDLVYINSSGKAVKGLAAAAGTALFAGVCLSDGAAGQAVDVLVRGHVTGYGIDALDYGALVYLGDTGGADTAAGTVEVSVASVMPISDHGLSKVLYVNANLVTQASHTTGA